LDLLPDARRSLCVRVSLRFKSLRFGGVFVFRACVCVYDRGLLLLPKQEDNLLLNYLGTRAQSSKFQGCVRARRPAPKHLDPGQRRRQQGVRGRTSVQIAHSECALSRPRCEFRGYFVRRRCLSTGRASSSSIHRKPAYICIHIHVCICSKVYC